MRGVILDKQEAEDLYRYLEPLEELSECSEYLKRLLYVRNRCKGYMDHVKEKRNG